ncbi:MAG: hypothetical protein WCS37_13570 [Chloroflexota bacterium]
MLFFRAIGRITIRFFAGIGRFIGGFFRAVAKHPVNFGLSFLLIGGFIGLWVKTDGFGFKIGGSDNSVLSAQASQQSSGSSEDFLNAYGKLDAKAMWNNLSESLKQDQIANGTSTSEAMQKLLNTKVSELAKGKSTKPNYKFLWIRGQTNSDGSAVDIFRGDIEWPAAGDAMPKLIAYILTTDAEGKVKEVVGQSDTNAETGDPVLAAAFPTGPKGGKGKEAGYGTTDARRKAATEEFMSGITNFDAQRIWSTLSPTYQKELNDKKVTVESMQNSFDTFKKNAQNQQMKISYAGFTLRLSATYPNGNAVDNYWSSLQISDQVQTPDYVLLLDSNYKVTAIGTSDPILSSGLGRKQQSQTGQ